MILFQAFPGFLVVKNLPAKTVEAGSIPELGRKPREGNGNPTPVFLPEKSHKQRNVMSYRPWGLKKVRYDLVNQQTKQNKKNDISLMLPTN